MQYVVRRARLRDVPGIVKVMRHRFPHWYRRLPYLVSMTFVIATDNTVLGFVAVAIRRRSGEIGAIAVSQDYEGLGLGSRLLGNALSYLKQKRASSCLAKVRLDNKPAERLFTRADFCFKKVLHRPILGDVLSMERDLRAGDDKNELRTTPNRYHEKRAKRGAWRYRLRRRTFEVVKAITQFGDIQPRLILDVGTSDGLMLEGISTTFDKSSFVGLDISREILAANPDRTFQPVQSGALSLPFREEAFDIVMASAIIEHLPDGKKFLSECQRVLRIGGLLIVTTPDPFFDRISGVITRQGRGFHINRFTLKELSSLFQSSGLSILKAEKFMMSPIGFPKEKAMERVMQAIGLGFLLMNQLLVATKEAKAKQR